MGVILGPQRSTALLTWGAWKQSIRGLCHLGTPGVRQQLHDAHQDWKVLQTGGIVSCVRYLSPFTSLALLWTSPWMWIQLDTRLSPAAAVTHPLCFMNVRETIMPISLTLSQLWKMCNDLFPYTNLFESNQIFFFFYLIRISWGVVGA